VDGAVQCPVTAPVESVTDGATAAGLQRAGAGQGGEGRVVPAPSGMGEADDGLGGADRSDAGMIGQAGREIVGDGLQLLAVVLERAGGLAQRDSESPDFGVPHSLRSAGLAR
jgi:hypothetical protein